MPHWEKIDAKGDEFYEALLEGKRLWVAKGTRSPGETQWSAASSHPREYGFVTEEEAKADYEKSVGKLSKKFVKTTDETPELEPYRAKTLAQRKLLADALEAFEAQYGLLAKLDAEGRVRLVGQKQSNAHEYWELEIQGTDVITRRGKLDGKGRPKTEKETYRTIDGAREGALNTMRSTLGILGFLPPK